MQLSTYEYRFYHREPTIAGEVGLIKSRFAIVLLAPDRIRRVR